MRRVVFINQDLVYVENAARLVSMEELAKAKLGKNPKLLVGVVPSDTSRVLASARTLESAINQQCPPGSSVATELMATNTYQVYSVPDATLDALRALSNRVTLVPYPAAVARALSKESGRRSIVERTQVFLLGRSAEPEASENQREVVAVEVLESAYLFTALRGNEVLAVRLATGDVMTELQRTLASARLEAPVIVCTDEQVSLDLQANGFEVQEAAATNGFIGVGALEQVTSIRFLNQFESARLREAATRKRLLGYLAVAAVALAATGGARVYFGAREALATSTQGTLTAERDEQRARLVTLHQERLGAEVRKNSKQIRDELFDLVTLLPPQVELLNVARDQKGLSAVLERRAQAAPFSRAELVELLRASSFFQGARITEEYEGHLVRYVLTVDAVEGP
ncbi:MAG: hypothetical protein INH41_12100 [Myxococcaceae bacterium]|jgi:hypothetical protein|nr:hypothetical protein [Myxococcaceae bacterium]MCA3013127.1 hypothetical protein [Myxococcaceae bacterium]